MRVEARILFRLELPSHKSIGVKAKQGKTVAEVILILLVLNMVMVMLVNFRMSMLDAGGQCLVTRVMGKIISISTLKVLGPILLQYGWTVPEVEIYLDQVQILLSTKIYLEQV